MSPKPDMVADAVVAGAGAVGSAVALALSRSGRRVVMVDPAPMGANASGVAAGMLAPAFEALFDEMLAGQYPLLRGARDLWLGLADSLGLALDREGALAIGSRPQVTEWCDVLFKCGADARVLSPAETAKATPWLDGGWTVKTPDDWRLDPSVALAALRREGERLGASGVADRVVDMSSGRVALSSGGSIIAEQLIIATGASPALAELAPELRRLSSVKGQILRATWPASAGGPVVRGNGVYLCPAAGELVLGASMEKGRSDLEVDPRVVADLIARAARFSPGLERLDWHAAAGVRGETPDGLPLVGASETPGVILAVGARRNGWLLAPLIAAIVVATADGAPNATAKLFDPARRLVSPG